MLPSSLGGDIGDGFLAVTLRTLREGGGAGSGRSKIAAWLFQLLPLPPRKPPFHFPPISVIQSIGSISSTAIRQARRYAIGRSRCGKGDVER